MNNSKVATVLLGGILIAIAGISFGSRPASR